MYKVLFVCTGNICRSPTAEGALRHYVETMRLKDKIMVDSAGTQGFHIGDAPDPRSIKAAQKRGIHIDGLRARKVAPSDFHEFDLILALDGTHLRYLQHIAPDDATAHTDLLLEYAGHPHEKEVPDPYYGDQQDFEYVLDLIEASTKPLIEKLQLQLR